MHGLIEKKRIESIVENYKPLQGDLKFKRPRRTVTDELEELLEKEDIRHMSGKEVSRIIDKYHQNKKPDLSFEAKATLDMLKPEAKISEIVEQERELLTEDIDKVDLVPSHGDDSGIFKCRRP